MNASGVLPIRVDVPRAGVSHQFVKPLVVVALPALLAWWIVRVGVSTVAVWIVEQRVWLLAGAVALATQRQQRLAIVVFVAGCGE